MGLLAVLLTAFLAFTGCSDDDDSPVDAGTMVSGNYAGTTKPINATDSPAPAYATLERRAANTVTFELVCETFGQDFEPVFLTCTENADGSVGLSSESQYAIYGTFKNGTLTITYDAGSYTWVFTGSKS